MLIESFLKQTMIFNRPILIDGRFYTYGDKVDMTKLPERLGKRLIEQRYLRPMTEGEAKEALQAPQGDEAKQPPAAAASIATGSFVASHKGFGRWMVLGPDGKEVAGPMKQAEAEAEASKRNGGA